MAKLTAYQQGLLDRYKRARQDGDQARAAIEEAKRTAAQAAKDQDMYATALEREGLNVERLIAAEPKQDAPAVNAEENGRPANPFVVLGFNKTHAVIEVFQKSGAQGLGPTEAWQAANEAYPKNQISRVYVNTLVGKLRDRGLLIKDEESGKYVLTPEGQKFQVVVKSQIFKTRTARNQPLNCLSPLLWPRSSVDRAPRFRTRRSQVRVLPGSPVSMQLLLRRKL